MGAKQTSRLRAPTSEIDPSETSGPSKISLWQLLGHLPEVDFRKLHCVIVPMLGVGIGGAAAARPLSARAQQSAMPEAKTATTTIPIVFMTSADPVATGRSSGDGQSSLKLKLQDPGAEGRTAMTLPSRTTSQNPIAAGIEINFEFAALSLSSFFFREHVQKFC